MSDNGCACDSSTVEQTATGTDGQQPGADQGRWMEDGIADTELPAKLKRAMGAFLGEGDVESVDAFFAELRSRLDQESLTVEDLCHADEQTPHWGELDGQRYHFQCFYDAVVLAEMTDSETRVRTESPDGTVIEGTATGSGEFTVQPAGAVMSFGIQHDGERPVESLKETYAAICPYVNAFPSRAAYERWAADVSPETVAMEMADGTDLVRLISE